MVLISNQIDNLTKGELIEELLKLFDINNQLKAFNNKFHIFVSKDEKLKSELLIKKNNSLLHQQII